MPNFAALEARVNRACAHHLANAEMVFAGGSVAVVFERAEEGMPATMGAPRKLNEWQAGAPVADFAAYDLGVGTTGAINGSTYQITDLATDHDGWQTLKLRKV